MALFNAMRALSKQSRRPQSNKKNSGIFYKKNLIIFEEDLKNKIFLWIKTQESEGFQGGA